MGIRSSLKQIWRHLGRADKTLGLLLAAYGASLALGTGGSTRLLLLAALVTMAMIVGTKWLRFGIRKAIWRLRNRLIVAYLFIGLVPILLIGLLAYGFAFVVAGQVSVYLMSSELNRRLTQMHHSAESLARAPSHQREQTWQRVQGPLGEIFPDVEAVIQGRGLTRFPADREVEPPPDGWGEIEGIVLKDGVLYAWSRAIAGRTEVTLTAPITQRFLLSLAPGIGNVAILEAGSNGAAPETAGRPMPTHAPMPGEPEVRGSPVPPPKNRFDFSFTQAASIPIATWNQPGIQDEGGLLSIHGRFSAVLDLIFSENTNTGDVLFILTGVAIIFLVVELVSLFIGVSITRTITSAFHELYTATELVRQGVFSHRIAVRGNDQLAVVSDSFNRMTENLERLLAVAKEKERMQAELEIAQAVQQQLYPKSVPELPGMELLAKCNPARMVSGDYYDYQALGRNAAVIAIGDVAGKGISAALLMATLQSAIRTHVRGCLDNREANDGRGTISTSQLVSQLNEQLFADTSPEKYSTFLFSVYDDDSGTLTYTNAGHLPPVLIRGGRPVELDVNGMVVGAFPFAQYGESQVQLESGDLLLAFTDGISEPENEYGEMFGEKRATEIVLKNAHRSLDEIIMAVMEAVEEWTGSPELQDDMTILVARKH